MRPKAPLRQVSQSPAQTPGRASSRLTQGECSRCPSFQNSTIVNELSAKSGQLTQNVSSLCKSNNFTFPEKLNQKFHFSLNLADFQQVSDLSRSNLACQLIIKQMNLFTKVSNSVQESLRNVSIYVARNTKAKRCFSSAWAHQRADASRRESKLCLLQCRRKIAHWASLWSMNRETV